MLLKGLPKDVWNMILVQSCSDWNHFNEMYAMRNILGLRKVCKLFNVIVNNMKPNVDGYKLCTVAVINR